MPHNLIYSRRPDFLPMTPPEIERRAPSVYAIDKAPHLSERYGQITTGRAVQIMLDHGFYPVQVAQVGQSKTAKHMIAFSPEYHPSKHTDARPELILYNSHDGTSALKLFGGFFRFICSNGIVAGEGFKSRLLHNASSVSGFEQMIADVVSRLPQLHDKMETMRSTIMSEPDALEFVKVGATYRWAEDRVTDNTILDLMTPRRREDHKSDMWTTYNRLQEGLIRGRVRVGPENRLARPIGSINQNLEINTKLWELV